MVIFVRGKQITFFFFNCFKCLFICERETECEWGRSRERGRHRIQSRLEALSCQHRAWRRTHTHELWDRDLSQSRTITDWATQVPRKQITFDEGSLYWERLIVFLADNGLIITGQPYSFIIVINGLTLIYQAMLEESRCYYYRILLCVWYYIEDLPALPYLILSILG